MWCFVQRAFCALFSGRVESVMKRNGILDTFFPFYTGHFPELMERIKAVLYEGFITAETRISSKEKSDEKIN